MAVVEVHEPIVVGAPARGLALLSIVGAVLVSHVLLLEQLVELDEPAAVARPSAVRVRSVVVQAPRMQATELAAQAPLPVQGQAPPAAAIDRPRAGRRNVAATAPLSARPLAAPLALSSAQAGETERPTALPWPEQSPYPTRPPGAITLHYELRRGSQTGRARLRWQPDSNVYEASFDGELDGAPLWRWSSRGAFDAGGVAPERFVAQGRRRSAQAVNFQRDSARISFSGPSYSHPLAEGAQDRLSWIAQLAAIVGARVPRSGDRIVMQVAGPRGDADSWCFDVLGDEIVETPGRSVTALHLRHQRQQRYDTSIEVWLDPARHYWPVRALLAGDGGTDDPLELLLVPADPDSPHP